MYYNNLFITNWETGVTAVHLHYNSNNYKEGIKK